MQLKIFFCLIFFSLAVKQGSGQATVDSLYVYPNPFDQVAVIHFDIIDNDTVTLTVTDINGQVQRTFFTNTILPSGSYNINFNSANLPNGIYFVRLQYGTNKILNYKAVKVGSVTAIESSSLNEKLILFPNPATNFFNIPLDGMKNILISNLNGQICKSIKTDTQLISVADLPIGFYSVQVFDSNNKLVVIKKLIKDE